VTALLKTDGTECDTAAYFLLETVVLDGAALLLPADAGWDFVRRSAFLAPLMQDGAFHRIRGVVTLNSDGLAFQREARRYEETYGIPWKEHLARVVLGLQYMDFRRFIDRSDLKRKPDYFR